MYIEDTLSKYIFHLMSKVNGMRMWAAWAYDTGIGIRAAEESATDGVFDLFAGTIWKYGNQVKSLNEIDDTCTCDIHNQIMVSGKIITIRLGEFPIKDIENKEGRVYFTIEV